MKASRFASTAARERPRFASPGQILGFGFAMTLALLAVFPDQSLERRLESSAYGDSVSLAYLGAWLRAKPDDYHLRLVLARRQIQQGELVQAESTLKPMLTASEVEGYDRAEAELMILEVREQQMWRLKPDSESFAIARSAYLAQLRVVTRYSWESARMEEFARQAMALGDTRLGRDLYFKLIKDNPYHSLAWYERIAQIDLAEGQYEAAANIYFSALPYTVDMQQRRQYFLAGLKILQSGNLMKEAIAAGDAYVGPLVDDRESLLYLIRLALASNRSDIAEKYVSRLLRQRVSAKEGAG